MGWRSGNLRRRRLRIEPLEIRNLLAAVTGAPCDFGESAEPAEITPAEGSFGSNGSSDSDGIAARGLGNVHEGNLERLGLAALNFESALGRFPAHAIYSRDGQPLLSWRVALLPYLGESDLFSQFHHDEPWDSPHNISLLDDMPEVYRNPWLPFDWPVQQPVIDNAQFKTVYQAMIGPDTMMDGEGRGLTYGSATDGDQNTAMFVQSARTEAVEWTKPQDLLFDAANPRAGLGWSSPDGFWTVLVDGSVHSVSPQVDDFDLTNLILRNDGEFVDFSEITPYNDVEDNLAAIALASLNYESATQRLPARAIVDRFTGEPLLSWRIRILPYLGYRGLYDQFNKFEAWNSLHNLPLMTQMPRVFADPELANGLTKLLAFDHPDSAFTNCISEDPRSCRGLPSGGISDGLSQTAMVIDAAVESAVPWSAPWDLAFDEDFPRAGLDFDAPDGVHVVLGDTTVVEVPFDVSDADLVNLVRVNDGEVIEFLFYDQSYSVAERIVGVTRAALYYESANNEYVSRAIVSPSGDPLLSWRVALLPYLPGGHSLYAQFRLDEPWDSPHNIQFAEQAPAIFADAQLPRGFTKLLGFVHPDSVLPSDGDSVRVRDIRDGTSNTVFLADADVSAAVEWTRPADIMFDTSNPFASVGENGTSGFYVGMLDGRGQMLPAGISETEMLNLILIDDGALTAPIAFYRPGGANPWEANLYERRARAVPDLLDRVFAMGE